MLAETWQTLGPVLMAFGIGLLVGIERGWRFRERPEGGRVAGVRTFSLIGLTGGLSAWLSQLTGPWLMMVAAAGMFLTALGFYVFGVRTTPDKGATTEVAAVATFLLGALAVLGDPLTVAALTVLLLAILGLKAPAHRLLERLDKAEISAFFQMVVLSVVVLPFLPNQGFGPGGVLNPVEVWLMVVFVQGINFFGHFAIRLWGAKAGVLLMGLLGGLASTTALTVSVAGLARKKGASADLLASSIAAASVIMAARALALVSLINFALTPLMAPALLLAAGAFVAAAFALHRRARRREPAGGRKAFIPPPSNLLTAFAFAGLLAAILVIAYYVERELAGAGVISLAAIAGLADVDAITISLAKLTQGVVEAAVTNPEVVGIFIALIANAVAKTGIAWVMGTRALALRTGAVYAIATVAGAIGFAVML